MKRHFALLIVSLITLSVTGQQVATSKLSSYLRQQVSELAQAERLHRASATTTIKVLTKLAADADEVALSKKHHFNVIARVGEVLIINIPLNQIEVMAQDPQVVRIECEQSPRPLLDMVPAQIGSDKANNNSDSKLPQAYTGEGVVIGIVDMGFDYVNPFFRDAEGKTRITWAADYAANKTYTTTDAIWNAKHSSDASTEYHGAHVAGIAAGSRIDDINDVYYQGIAPQATIAEANINSYAAAVQAFADIFAYAESNHKPCVINFSMGDAMSFSSERQLMEEAISTLLQKPGRAIVVASGNSGNSARLAHKTAAIPNISAGIKFDNSAIGTYMGIELKVKPTQQITLTAMDAAYASSKAEAVYTAAELADKGTFLFNNKQIKAISKGETADNYLVIYLQGISAYEATDRLQITIQGDDEAWIYADAVCAPLENVPDKDAIVEDGYSLTWPACLPEVITVGNIAHRFKILTIGNKYSGSGPTDLTEVYSTKGEGYLCKTSSIGPSLTGTMKPDVCAPGVNIVSAYNNFVNEDTEMLIFPWTCSPLNTEYEAENGGYFCTLAQSGSSMSAPAVSGTIALWLQADPTLTTEKIKTIIANSSRQPDSELTYPNNQYGYGEIDAYKGLLYMHGLTDVREISQYQPSKTHFRLAGRQLYIDYDNDYNGPATIRIFSTDGRLLLTSQETVINLNALPSGVYAVQLTTDERETTGSSLIRL